MNFRLSKNVPPLQIGSLRLGGPLILAPLAGISDLPFRLLAREQGSALVFTEMISAEGLVRNFRKAFRFLHSSPEERPLAVQIFGSKAEVMARAGRIVQEVGADLLDLNMGCPARKVVGGGSGAALLKDLPRAEEIIRAVRRSVSIPLTVKIRSGWDERSRNFLDVARMAEEAGVDGLFLHARTRAQMFGGRADWGVIARVRESLKIPVIGNGDLWTPAAVSDFFRQTGCPAAMIGRGAMGRPWIFRESLALLQGEKPEGPTWEEKTTIMLRHLAMLTELRGEAVACREFRKHLIWYTRGLPGSAELRRRLPLLGSKAEVEEIIRDFRGEDREGNSPARGAAWGAGRPA